MGNFRGVVCKGKSCGNEEQLTVIRQDEWILLCILYIEQVLKGGLKDGILW